MEASGRSLSESGKSCGVAVEACVRKSTEEEGASGRSLNEVVGVSRQR